MRSLVLRQAADVGDGQRSFGPGGPTTYLERLVRQHGNLSPRSPRPGQCVVRRSGGGSRDFRQTQRPARRPPVGSGGRRVLQPLRRLVHEPRSAGMHPGRRGAEGDGHFEDGHRVGSYQHHLTTARFGQLPYELSDVDRAAQFPERRSRARSSTRISGANAPGSSRSARYCDAPGGGGGAEGNVMPVVQ
jgi:hypothetical protein